VPAATYRERKKRKIETRVETTGDRYLLHSDEWGGKIGRFGRIKRDENAEIRKPQEEGAGSWAKEIFPKQNLGGGEWGRILSILGEANALTNGDPIGRKTHVRRDWGCRIERRVDLMGA